MALKVLLADDSMTAQNMGKKILTDAGFDVATVSNGAAAIKKVAEYRPNIIILDIYMPGYTGLEVCERVRTTDSTTPILLTVGKLEPFRQEDVDQVHADAIIVKPFEATDLINTVQRFADQAGVAASIAAVPPPPPVVEVPPPPPPAQLSEEDLAFLRGEVTEQASPQPAVTSAAAVADTANAVPASPDFADLLAAPQTSHAEPNIPLNDFDLPPLTQEDFDMLHEGASAPVIAAHAEAPAPATAEIDLLAQEAPEPVSEALQPASIPQPTLAEIPEFQLDENLAVPEVTTPPTSDFGCDAVNVPAGPAPVLENAVAVSESAPVVEAAMAAAIPVIEPVYGDAAPAFASEPVLAVEASPMAEALPVEADAVAVQTPQAAEEFALELPAEEHVSSPSQEAVLDPVLETAPAAVIAETAPSPELEPLELETSGPQPAPDLVAPVADLAPAYEFIGATGTTPADADIEAVAVEHSALLDPNQAEPVAFEQPEPVVNAITTEASFAAAAGAAFASGIGGIESAPSFSKYEAAPELSSLQGRPEPAPVETAAPATALDVNYATVAGVVHRVFDRYKSQMIADIVRELAKGDQ